ncbi:putative multi-domain containing protein, partial [Aduncisulcus paluster]
PRKAFQSSVAVLAFGLRKILGLKRAPGEARERDALEAMLIREALENDIPLLGVCRGMQLINVVKGGSLHQEIADVYEDVSNPQTVLPHKKYQSKKIACWQRCSAELLPMLTRFITSQSMKLGRDLLWWLNVMPE